MAKCRGREMRMLRRKERSKKERGKKKRESMGITVGV